MDAISSNDTCIQLKILCREAVRNTLTTEELIKETLDKNYKKPRDSKIILRGRIGRVVSWLPLQWYHSIVERESAATSAEEKSIHYSKRLRFYERLWKSMEIRTFTAYQDNCNLSEKMVVIDSYSKTNEPQIKHEELIKLEEQDQIINSTKHACRFFARFNAGKVGKRINRNDFAEPSGNSTNNITQSEISDFFSSVNRVDIVYF
jgi:hypothetical protein